MADKAALEMIGVCLFVATLFVIGAGGFAVRHQLAIEQPRVETAELTLPDRVQFDRLQTITAGWTPVPAHSIK
jgi:hypothetical protein